MHPTKRRRLELRVDRIRLLTPPELAAIAGGQRADSNGATECPCPTDYSYLCKP